MPRTPKLGQKNGYWHTKAGNPNGVYFGKVGEVPYSTARQMFGEHLKSLGTSKRHQNSPLTVLELSEQFLDWIQENRSGRTYDERKRHLERFCNFRIGGTTVAGLAVLDIQADDLRLFLAHVEKEFGCNDFTKDKHATSIKHAFGWGTKHPSPVPLIPNSFRPFASIEKYKRPMTPLVEDDLLTSEEITALLRFADADLAAVVENRKRRRRRPDEYRPAGENPYVGFADMLTCYWHCGARTSELAQCRIRDFVRRTRQILLGKHKRVRTMRHQVARRITVNDETHKVLDRRCKGRPSDEPIFLDPKGKPWTRHTLDKRFSAVRERADVREGVTIYSFRHLWISEMLMAGNDIATVAKMAGTSVDMIERVYGHFTNDHFRDAQSRLDKLRFQQTAPKDDHPT